MRNFYAIYRKEMRHYFVSPIAYVFIGIVPVSQRVLLQFFSVRGHAAVVCRMEMQSMQFGMPAASGRAGRGDARIFSVCFRR